MGLHQWHAAARSLAHRRGLSVTVVATLTLGIGANSAIFSAVDAVLLRPLPYPAADRLVAIYERNAGLRQATQLVAPGRLEEWNAQNRTFSGLAASYFENMTDTSGALPERVEAMRLVERVGDLDRDRQRLGERYRALLQPRRQRLAFEILHHQEIGPVLTPDVVQRTNMRMVQRRHGASFAIKSLAQVGV